MRIDINNRNREKIELDLRVAKSNYRLRIGYLIESALLEKKLIYNNS